MCTQLSISDSDSDMITILEPLLKNAIDTCNILVSKYKTNLWFMLETSIQYGYGSQILFVYKHFLDNFNKC